MQHPVFIVDAFTSRLFGGNPAAVCPLTEWLPDETMQLLAAEHNLSETVFFVPTATGYHLRWFTPATEVKLYGHATLAAAHILYTELGYTADTILFDSLSGVLKVNRMNNVQIQLDFPAAFASPVDVPPAGLLEGLSVNNGAVYVTSFDYMVVLQQQQQVEMLQPDFKLLATVKARGVIVTAPGDDVDFVSRCFYPQSGIDEDPVTGSAHTIMVPYWAQQLGKTKLAAVQVSKRKGYLSCELDGDRVLMSGQAVTYLKGMYTC